MKKKIKKYGDSFVITFSREEREIYNLDEGDIIDVQIVKKEVQETNGAKRKARNRSRH